MSVSTIGTDEKHGSHFLTPFGCCCLSWTVSQTSEVETIRIDPSIISDESDPTRTLTSGGGLRSCLRRVGRLIWHLLCPTAVLLNALNEKLDKLNEKLDSVLHHILQGTPSNTSDDANPSSEDTRPDDETNT